MYFEGNSTTRPDMFSVVTRTTDSQGNVVEQTFDFPNKH